MAKWNIQILCAIWNVRSLECHVCHLAPGILQIELADAIHTEIEFIFYSPAISIILSWFSFRQLFFVVVEEFNIEWREENVYSLQIVYQISNPCYGWTHLPIAWKMMIKLLPAGISLNEMKLNTIFNTFQEISLNRMKKRMVRLFLVTKSCLPNKIFPCTKLTDEFEAHHGLFVGPWFCIR